MRDQATTQKPVEDNTGEDEPADKNYDTQLDQNNVEELDDIGDAPFDSSNKEADRPFETHPLADSDLDETELYNEGLEGAAGRDYHANSGVLGYEKPKDKTE